MSQYVTLVAVDSQESVEAKPQQKRSITVAIAGPGIVGIIGIVAGLFLWACNYWMPNGVIQPPAAAPIVVVQPPDAAASKPAAAVEVRMPTPVTRTLFGEYPAVLADQAANPKLRDTTIYISLWHLDQKRIASVSAVWQNCRCLTVVPGCNDLYRVTCTGATVQAFRNLTEHYPYALAPGEKTDLNCANAYWEVVRPSTFGNPVIRGDWFAANAHREPVVNEAFQLHADESKLAQYLDESLDLDDMFFGRGDAARILISTKPSLMSVESITRRAVEAKQNGDSLFVRWAVSTRCGRVSY